MSYMDYARTTWGQFLSKAEGYKRKEEGEWQRTRFASYIQYCASTEEGKRESIYDFLPLESDLPPKERAKLEARQSKQEAAKKERAALKLINDYKKKGYL